MKLASLRDGTRDGRLIVVSADAQRYAPPEQPTSLQQALDGWQRFEPVLRELDARLGAHRSTGEPLDLERLLAPLPRAYEWLDGSAFLSHVRLARKARGAALPPGLERDPLVYQGGSGVLLSARTPIALPDPAHGLDLEAEICAVTADVPAGSSAAQCGTKIRLLMLANDLSYRSLIAAELAKGFGFVNSKPPTAFSPFAVTLDELGAAYRNDRLHARVKCWINGREIGHPSSAEMHFSFAELIAHVAKTRSLTAGTIVGSGTVSNEDPSSGACCIAELRAREMIAGAAPTTPFLGPGDTIRIEAFTEEGISPFGAIEQTVVSKTEGARR